jgi:hypothetical protein
MRYFILFAFIFSNSIFATENPAKQIKKQMCFETYPRVTYRNNTTHEWTINEVMQNPSVYKTYKLITSNKTKSDSIVLFDFTGISHQYNIDVPISGSAFYTEVDGWTLSVNSSTKLGDRNSSENVPYVSSMATWDMYSNINVPGTSGGFLKFDSVAPVTAPDNVYEVSVVNLISCNDYSRITPQ